MVVKRSGHARVGPVDTPCRPGDAPRMDRATRAAATLVVVTAMVAGACGNEPQIPELTDPTEILAAAAATTAAATTVHIDATADGQLSLGLAGATAPFELEGSTATADVDLIAGEGRATFALPGILGLRGEVIVVDGTAYAKTSLSGPDYVAVEMGGVAPTEPGGPSASPATASFLAALTQALARPELEPTKGADTDCGTNTCYTVTVELTADEIASLLGDGAGLDLPIPGDLPIPLPDLSSIASLDATVVVEKGSGHLARLTLVVGTGAEAAVASATAEATIEARFSKWDEDVTVEAPPADQVQGGG